MYTREKYRTLSRTLVVDARVRLVTAHQNGIAVSNNTAVGIPADGNYVQRQFSVGPTGVELPESKGLLYIDTAEPIILQLGNASITIEGQYIVTGKHPACVLVSDELQTVNVIQY
ncbi:hypothetical protein YOLOSWAG_134 [Erwinia phage vB_EamM_Yoloswag]|uniref:Uncharacterized protein n=1 Tax=Erwinia phage vB_EamM_Yoloswag TaxID=1958956 RepID=A0A1S6L352_9CAUD|nr:hypothetical protein HOR66_gp134 [Erwinia phage vB_EamM_Yoloswag]AQT28614.1 hypothetical protein YOLOSWAG_134 [Erwinia phage vB_EamM_Yoloswag]